MDAPLKSTNAVTPVRDGEKREVVMLRVLKVHRASFDYSVVFKKGDQVTVGREDPGMPGWYWCENTDGVWSWIPAEYLDREGTIGTITQDYDTTELTVEAGDTLEYVAQVKFWTLCRTRDGLEGWVPTANLEHVLGRRG
jgi:hypothetical protein